MYPCEVVSLRWEESCHIEKCPSPRGSITTHHGVTVSEQGSRHALAEEERPKAEGEVGGQVGGSHASPPRLEVSDHPSYPSLAFPASILHPSPRDTRQTL